MQIEQARIAFLCGGSVETLCFQLVPGQAATTFLVHASDDQTDQTTKALIGEVLVCPHGLAVILRQSPEAVFVEFA